MKPKCLSDSNLKERSQIVPYQSWFQVYIKRLFADLAKSAFPLYVQSQIIYMMVHGSRSYAINI